MIEVPVVVVVGTGSKNYRKKDTKLQILFTTNDGQSFFLEVEMAE